MQNVKSGVHSFRVRLTYTHSEASRKLQDRLPNNRRRDIGIIIIGENFIPAVCYVFYDIIT